MVDSGNHFQNLLYLSEVLYLPPHKQPPNYYCPKFGTGNITVFAPIAQQTRPKFSREIENIEELIGITLDFLDIRYLLDFKSVKTR